MQLIKFVAKVLNTIAFFTVIKQKQCSCALKVGMVGVTWEGEVCLQNTKNGHLKGAFDFTAYT